MRTAKIERKTKETDIVLELNIDGTGQAEISTGIGFFDHMLNSFARHGFFDLKVSVDGDLDVDCHHTIEDVGLALGQAIRQAIGDKASMTRYGFFFVPMDEALCRVCLDLSGRPYLVFDAPLHNGSIGGFDCQMTEEFFRALSNESGMTLHISVPYGKNDHHMVEAMFKAFARALDMATTLDARVQGVPSTKGVL